MSFRDGILLGISKAVNELELHNYQIPYFVNYEHHQSWGFSRVCMGWAQYRTPALSIRIYQDILAKLKEHNLDNDVLCYFNSGNIEFRDKEKLKNDNVKKEIEHSDQYVRFYSEHSHYIDELKEKLRESEKEHGFSHIISPCHSRYFMTNHDMKEYKGHDLSNSFIYMTNKKEEVAKEQIKIIKNICDSFADFTFVVNEKKGEMNGYYCLFIIPKKE